MEGGQLALLGALIRRLAPTGANRGQVRLPFGDPAPADSLTAAAVESGDEVGVWAAGAMGRRLTQEKAAARLSISVPYLRRAERVLERTPDLAMQVWSGELKLNNAYEMCMEPARPVGYVRRGSATAPGEGIADRTGQRREFEEPSGSRNTMAIESTFGGEDPQALEALSTDGEGAAHPMPAPGR